MAALSLSSLLTIVFLSANFALLKVGSDDHTQIWCELVATVSAPICSVMFPHAVHNIPLYVNSL